jgi:hypothetical protein
MGLKIVRTHFKEPGMILPGFFLCSGTRNVNNTNVLWLLGKNHGARRISSLISRIGFAKIDTVYFLPNIDTDNSNH